MPPAISKGKESGSGSSWCIFGNRRPYRLEPVAMGQAARGMNLDKALALAGRLEDEELVRKLELRK